MVWKSLLLRVLEGLNGVWALALSLRFDLEAQQETQAVQKHL